MLGLKVARISCGGSAHEEYLQTSNSGQQPIDLVGRRVARAARADKAFVAEAVTLDDRGCVKIAMRHENAAVGEPTGHFGRSGSIYCERDRRGSRCIGRHSIEGNAVNLGKTAPHLFGEGSRALVECRVRCLQLSTAVGAFRQRRQEVDGGRGSGDAFVIERAGLRSLRAALEDG